MDDTNKELQDLFNTVYSQIQISVGNKQLTTESFQTILLKIVDTVEKFSKAKPQELTGTEKRAIAINLTHLVVDKLHESGQIDEQTYNWMSTGVTFLAPILFDAIKAAWKKLHEVIEDIEEHGKSGCCARNF